jgi:glycosyltransferase involved in cell wall biosynthesis
VFFEGFVHREHIWDYYADADAFVLLSRAEALGVVLWEAMKLNVPVLVADVPGMLESVGADMARGRVWQEAEGERGFIEKIAFCTTRSADRDHMLARAQSWLAIQLSNTVSINDLAIFAHKVQ